jgi:hypothetical protein
MGVPLLPAGSPESQVVYTVAGGLIIPAILIALSVIIWCFFWLYRWGDEEQGFLSFPVRLGASRPTVLRGQVEEEGKGVWGA